MRIYKIVLKSNIAKYWCLYYGLTWEDCWENRDRWTVGTG